MYPIERTRTMYPIEVVPSALTVHNEWNVSCTHTASELEQRIPLNFIYFLNHSRILGAIFRGESAPPTAPHTWATKKSIAHAVFPTPGDRSRIA